MDCIILAGGVGSRAKLTYPKQLLRLGGKPILIHVLELFSSIPEIDNIIVTVPNNLDEFKSLLSNYNIDAKCIIGGDSRQKSVKKALSFTKTDRIVIHEAARPFITREFVESIIEVMDISVVPYLPSNVTIFDKNKWDYVNRDGVYNIQLPQVFDREKLVKAHASAKNKTYSDDSSLLFGELGISPYFVLGMEENIKITTPLDILIAGVLYENWHSNRRD